MLFGDFEVWKLHSVTDYLFFIFYVAVIAGVVFLIIKRINNGRNDAAAAKRIAKKLKVKAGKGKVYNDVTLDLGGEMQHYDHIIVDAAGIVTVKTIGRGLKIYGEPDSDTWKMSDNKEDNVRIPNPIKELRTSHEKLRKLLSAKGVYRANIDSLAIFADPFAPAELYLGRDSGCINHEGVKTWMKNRQMRAAGKAGKEDALNISAAVAALDSAVITKE